MNTETLTRPEHDAVEKKIQQLRDLYADGPEIGRAALESLIDSMKAGTNAGEKASSAGRTGLRQGKVSELTTVLKLVPSSDCSMSKLIASRAVLNVQVRELV